MPRCNYCLVYKDSLVYKDEVTPPLVCEDCARQIDDVTKFLNNFEPEKHLDESENWKNT